VLVPEGTVAESQSRRVSEEVAGVKSMIAEGAATLILELYDSANIKQLPPYFRDARLEPFTIEVTT
jgi:hypothetical protein